MSDNHSHNNNHNRPDLPGLDEAIAQLRYDTTAHRDSDDPYADCFPDPLPEIPYSGPVSVDSALSAMITLQLGAAHDAIKSPGMIPPPGALHMIEVPNAGARERVGSIVQAMVDEGSVSGVTPPRVIEQIGAGKSIDSELFQKRIEKSMLIPPYSRGPAVTRCGV